MGTDDIIVPYWADVNSLILIEVGMSADEESLLHSSFEPVLLSTDDSAASPVNPVVFLSAMLYLLLHFGSSSCALTVWF